jgi:hypothetical protein
MPYLYGARVQLRWICDQKLLWQAQILSMIFAEAPKHGKSLACAQSQLGITTMLFENEFMLSLTDEPPGLHRLKTFP